MKKVSRDIKLYQVRDYMNSVNVYVDGSFIKQGDNKRAGAGIVVVGDDLKIRFFSLPLGSMKTSQRVEKSAVKNGIEIAKNSYKDKSIFIHSDCLNVVRSFRSRDDQISILLVNSSCDDFTTKFFMRKAHILSRKASAKNNAK